MGLVPPGCLADGLVAGGEQNDADKRDDQRERAADVPAAEDDAEVGCVPGEQHLCWCQPGGLELCNLEIGSAAYVHVALVAVIHAGHARHVVVHMTVIHV